MLSSSERERQLQRKVMSITISCQGINLLKHVDESFCKHQNHDNCKKKYSYITKSTTEKLRNAQGQKIRHGISSIQENERDDFRER
jgi:hypothetical protein